MLRRMLLTACLCCTALAGCSPGSSTEGGPGPEGNGLIVHIAPMGELPGNIVYKEAAAAANTNATKKILNAFSANHTDADGLSLLQNEILICGPFLWAALSDSPELTNLKCAITEIKVPEYQDGEVVHVETLHGQAFQTTGEVARFWHAFERYYNFDSPRTVRKLNARELEVYWAMIPYDIEEPIFIVESIQHKILLDFVEPDLQVLWIDDYQAIEPPSSNKTPDTPRH